MPRKKTKSTLCHHIKKELENTLCVFSLNNEILQTEIAKNGFKPLNKLIKAKTNNNNGSILYIWLKHTFKKFNRNHSILCLYNLRTDLVLSVLLPPHTFFFFFFTGLYKGVNALCPAKAGVEEVL